MTTTKETASAASRSRTASRKPKPLHFNTGDTATTHTALVDLYYIERGVKEKWDADRIKRLCGFLRCTPYELSSLVMLPHVYMTKYLDGRAFVSGPVALHFTMIEKFFLGDIAPDAIVGHMPPLGIVSRLMETHTGGIFCKCCGSQLVAANNKDIS